MSPPSRKSGFICSVKYHNELPLPPLAPKLLAFHHPKDRFSSYVATEWIQNRTLPLFVEPDLGMPLDLVDMEKFDPDSYDDKDLMLNHEDNVLLQTASDSGENNEKGKWNIPWLRPTDIMEMDLPTQKLNINDTSIKSVSKQSVVELSRDSQMEAIEQTFAALNDPYQQQLSQLIHPTQPHLKAEESLDIYPDFEGWSNTFTQLSYDTPPIISQQRGGSPALDEQLSDDHMEQIQAIQLESSILQRHILSNDAMAQEKLSCYMVDHETAAAIANMENQQKEMGLSTSGRDQLDMKLQYEWVHDYQFHVENKAQHISPEEKKMHSNLIITVPPPGDLGPAYYNPIESSIKLRARRSERRSQNRHLGSQHEFPSSHILLEIRAPNLEEKLRAKSKLLGALATQEEEEDEENEEVDEEELQTQAINHQNIPSND